MMQRPVSLSPRAALLIGAALLSTPALAQDTTQTVTPPPVVSTAPQPAAPAPVTFAPSTPTVQSVPAEAEPAAPAPRASAARSTRTTARATTRTTTTRAARAAPAATAPAAAPAPAAAAPAPSAAPPVETATGPAPEAVPPAETAPAPATEPAAASTTPIWPFALIGALILAAAAFFLLRRRRRTEYDEVFEEEAYSEPAIEPARAEPVHAPPIAAAVPEPVAAVPLAEPRPEPVMEGPIETEAVAVEAASEDLAGVTGASAPVAHRPWLEFGMRPVRAGTSEEEAMVEIELTVGNSGDMPAEDVRISTFMLANGRASEVENMLIEHEGEGAEVTPGTIPAGEGKRIDATLAAPKGAIGDSFEPVVVADARYRLPDGSEGRTAAAFRIGRAGNDGIAPIGAMRPHITEDVEAELDQLLERA